MSDATFEDVLAFWLGPLDAEGRADQDHAARWYRKDPEFDEEIRRRFSATYEAVAGGGREEWLKSPRGRLAYIVVLDQFSRNLFRGSEKAFAHDERARAAALEGVAQKVDRQLALDERGFFYMPLMHAEDRATQDRCVQLFSSWHDELTGKAEEKIAGMLDYAERHRSIVRRFGRFPHRNAVLGRASTPEEAEFLTQKGSAF
jgi:uncharacterized protein (DUF924 family)